VIEEYKEEIIKSQEQSERLLAVLGGQVIDNKKS
jgi:hypothetical protein